MYLFDSHFELEYEEHCYYDSLCVYGVKFCGFWLAGQTHKHIVPANSNFTLGFIADGSVVYSGFKVNHLKKVMQKQAVVFKIYLKLSIL